jgi:hypothetical protein
MLHLPPPLDQATTAPETRGMRFQYRTVPYRTVPRRDGIEKKRSRAGRDGTVSISRGTGRYAVSGSYTALPCRRKKSFNNDFQ